MAANRARFGRIALAIVVLLMASSYVRPAVDWVNARSAAGERGTTDARGAVDGWVAVGSGPSIGLGANCAMDPP